MRVSIRIEFDVTPGDEDLANDEDFAKEAAEVAAREFLSFVKVSGYSSDVEEVSVHVDGYGEAKVRLAD